jgi:hypothetical protein
MLVRGRTMPQVTIWLPEEVHRLVQEVRALGIDVNLSAAAARAIRDEALGAAAALAARAEATDPALRAEAAAWLEAGLDPPLEPDPYWDAVAAEVDTGLPKPAPPAFAPEPAAPPERPEGRAAEVAGPRVDAAG